MQIKKCKEQLSRIYNILFGGQTLVQSEKLFRCFSFVDN
jgi:hypothetical protein